MLTMKRGSMVVVTHPPKLPNASEIEKKVIRNTTQPKPKLNIDKKPLG